MNGARRAVRAFLSPPPLSLFNKAYPPPPPPPPPPPDSKSRQGTNKETKHIYAFGCLKVFIFFEYVLPKSNFTTSFYGLRKIFPGNYRTDGKSLGVLADACTDLDPITRGTAIAIAFSFHTRPKHAAITYFYSKNDFYSFYNQPRLVVLL